MCFKISKYNIIIEVNSSHYILPLDVKSHNNFSFIIVKSGWHKDRNSNMKMPQDMYSLKLHI